MKNLFITAALFAGLSSTGFTQAGSQEDGGNNSIIQGTLKGAKITLNNG